MRGVQNSLSKRITLVSDICKHPFVSNGVEGVKEVTKIQLACGKIVCPVCERNKSQLEMQKKYQAQYEEYKKDEKSRYFRQKSMITDETIKQATLFNYKPTSTEASKNLELVKNALGDYLKGEKFNLVFQGDPGVGKSHLSYALAKELNSTNKYEVLFVSADELFRRIRATFSKNDVETEDDIVKEMIRPDFLIVDDLGAEIGKIDTTKTASDFIVRVLRSVTDGRQSKCTIYTTNLTGEQLQQIYDPKTVSRMFRVYKYVVFKETKDFRINRLPF